MPAAAAAKARLAPQAPPQAGGLVFGGPISTSRRPGESAHP